MPKGERLVSRLEAQFRVHAARPALKNGSCIWSYKELDAITARIAAGLQQRCENLDAPILLLMRHDLPLIAAIVGVLRSGGFYLAFNPSHPPERLREIIEAIRPSALITDVENQETARALGLLDKNVFLFEELSTFAGSFVARRPSSPDLAAVFYTSGSSGKPKAITYSQRTALHSGTVQARGLQISSQDRVALLSSCSAAASISSLFGALTTGACILPFSPVQEGLQKLRTWIETEEITVYHSVPSLFRRLAQSLPAGEIIPSIRIVKLGGESAFVSDIELFRAHFRQDAVLINGLGSTEANGNVAHFHVLRDTNVSTQTMPIGPPLPEFEIKLIDSAGNEVGPGKVGEIVLRGEYLSPGYWTRNGLQSIPKSDDGWFRTGDLGRCDSEGTLEHLGRKDDQLKRDGLWLSPAEVESALMRIPGVCEAAAIAVDGRKGVKSLIGFLSWKTSPWSAQSLRLELRKHLPLHSVPNQFVAVEELPLLGNGKIDRVSLAKRASELLQRKDSKVEPQDLLELQLVHLWEGALKLEAIGSTDDFFVLGGDSLDAATMLGAVDKFFGVNLPVSALLEAPTVQKLAGLIRRGGWSEKGMRLLAFRVGGNKPPLYCVPGAGCDALEFRLLKNHLGEDQPVFAFQPEGLDGDSRCLRSVEEMADSYLAAMRIHQPHGPYYLCGTSFGGAVAFEMARRLVSENEEMRFLGLLDAYGGEYPKRRKHLAPRKRLKFALQYFLPFGEKDTFCLQAFKKGLKEWVKRRLFNLGLFFNLPPPRRPYQLRFVYLQEACFAARRRYKLKPFSGKIHLFRAERQPPSDLYESDPFLGWGGMAEGGVEIHQLPGDHSLYLREPNVGTLARELSSCLADASNLCSPARDPGAAGGSVPLFAGSASKRGGN